MFEGLGARFMPILSPIWVINGEKSNFFLKKVWWKEIFALSLHSQSGKTESCNASLAQLVEHDTLNVGVQGSSP